MIIIKMSWENNDVNVFGLYNKIESSHIYKKLVCLKIKFFGWTIKLVRIAWKIKVIL